MNDMDLHDCEEELAEATQALATTKKLLWKERTFVWSCAFFYFLYFVMDAHENHYYYSESIFWPIAGIFSMVMMVVALYKWYQARKRLKALP